MRTLCALMLALTACASTPELIWHCADGPSFKLHYDKLGRAVVSTDNHLYVLPPAPSGSGARYSDGIAEYWEHQGEATLTGVANGPYRQCRSGVSVPAKPAAD
jgi:membrane-bound inhibitor of C-type lysozyme